MIQKSKVIRVHNYDYHTGFYSEFITKYIPDFGRTVPSFFSSGWKFYAIEKNEVRADPKEIR